MIKLTDILKEINLDEASKTSGVRSSAHLWPFSETDDLASSWENTRLANLFYGSLKGMFTYKGELDSITNDSDIEKSEGDRAGKGSYDIHIHRDHSVVKKLYKEKEVERKVDHSHQDDTEKWYVLKKMPAGETPKEGNKGAAPIIVKPKSKVGSKG